jgi:hypothetical protein
MFTTIQNSATFDPHRTAIPSFTFTGQPDSPYPRSLDKGTVPACKFGQLPHPVLNTWHEGYWGSLRTAAITVPLSALSATPLLTTRTCVSQAKSAAESRHPNAASPDLWEGGILSYQA